MTATMLPQSAFTVGRPRRNMPWSSDVVVQKAGRVHQLGRHADVQQRGRRGIHRPAEEVHHQRSQPLSPAADAEVPGGIAQRVGSRRRRRWHG